MGSGPPCAPVILIKTLVDTKAAPGEVGGKRAASCARYLEALVVETTDAPGELGGKRIALRARYLGALMV